MILTQRQRVNKQQSGNLLFLLRHEWNAVTWNWYWPFAITAR